MTQAAITPPPESPPASGIASQCADTARVGPVVTLNAFQVLMRRWAALHPYNAGQVMQVTGAGDVERWKHAVESVLGTLGLGCPRFTEGDFEVRYVAATDVLIEQTERDFAKFFNEELNRKFGSGELPLRFTIISRGDNTHYFAAVYDHWIGDSRAMRELMQRIFAAYQDPERPSKLPALTLEAPAFHGLFKHRMGLIPRRTQALVQSMLCIWNNRHAFRVNLMDPLNFESRFIYTTLPAGLIERIYKWGKQNQGSVNDVFLAVLGQTMGVWTEHERQTRRHKRFHFYRRQVGLGTIMDIREAAGENLDRVFGLYLSSYTVVLDRPEHEQLGALAKRIAAYTGRIKKTYAAVRGFYSLVMARFCWDAYDDERYRAQLFHKSVPVSAGISNVNMTKSWADQVWDKNDEKPQILDYLRISPTGPLGPLVFTLTTIRDRLSLCVTYRPTAFSDEQANALVAEFVKRLGEVGP